MEECDYRKYYYLYENSFVPGSKMSVYVSKDTIELLTVNFGTPKLTDSRYFGSFMCLISKVNDKFSPIFAKKLQQLTEAGLIGYNMRFLLEKNNPKRWEVESGAQILTLEELEAGFVVCMAPLAISALVFCLEWLITLKNFLVFNFIFKKLFAIRLTSKQAAARIWFKKLNQLIEKRKQKQNGD